MNLRTKELFSKLKNAKLWSWLAARIKALNYLPHATAWLLEAVAMASAIVLLVLALGEALSGALWAALLLVVVSGASVAVALVADHYNTPRSDDKTGGA